MKRIAKRALFAITALIAVIAGLAFLIVQPFAPVSGVGTQDVVVADPADKPLEAHIWYPAEVGDTPRLKGEALPLIVISHGTGGNSLGHNDTATALAKAGNVVAAVTHTGDNFKDLSYVGKGTYLMGRPRHISRLIDYMLSQWPEHARIDSARIGMFGHSAGGFTALVVGGATPDMTSAAAKCREIPKSWGCTYWKSQGLNPDSWAKHANLPWVQEARVKAAVIAAPALGYTFEKKGLSPVQIPVQIWEAQHDAIVDDSPTAIRKMLPPATEYHMVKNTGHFSFLMPCNAGMTAAMTLMSWFGTERICDDPTGFDRAKFHSEFNKEVVGFFAKTLAPDEP